MHLETLHEAICDPEVGLADITKVEIEYLPGGSFRWTAWDGDRRLVCAPFKFHELRDYLVRVELIMEAMHAQPPARYASEVTHA